MIRYILNLLFTTYSFLLLARVLGSWIPKFAESRFMVFLSFYTDPYLKIFRKIIPPIGMIDLSPMFALLSLELLQMLINGILK